MDRASLGELANYLDFAWGDIRASVTAAGDDVLSREAPGSGWPALRDCLGHVLFGYDHWLGVLRERPLSFDQKSLLTYADLDAQRSQLVGELREFLAANSDQELRQMRDHMIRGQTLPYTRGELVAHMLLHERGHHGDVTTLLYQLGIDQPALDYRHHLQRRGGV